MQHDTEGLHRLSESSGPGYALRAKWILPTAVAPDLFRRNSGAYSREVIEQLRAQLTERDLVVRRRLRLRAVAACVDIVFVYSQCEWASACKRTSDDGWCGGTVVSLLTY